ncbi:uncharacterized protein LOC111347182, partial [Stylophora pistillata]|uniref:uncharacterized protein LOC111347182 n=1 Tax=Stylophora pistillata TaxID=50429 RepID=UPI000C03A697
DQVDLSVFKWIKGLKDKCLPVFMKPGMASLQDESDMIKKTAVVLEEEFVLRGKETDEVFLPTLHIDPGPELRREIFFTKKMTPDDIKEMLKKTFPILADTERFYCAKAVFLKEKLYSQEERQKKLDFCGERRIWSGKVLNKEIRKNSLLYICCEVRAIPVFSH